MATPRRGGRKDWVNQGEEEGGGLGLAMYRGVPHVSNEELITRVGLEVLVPLDVHAPDPVSFLLQPLHQVPTLQRSIQSISQPTTAHALEIRDYSLLQRHDRLSFACAPRL